MECTDGIYMLYMLYMFIIARSYHILNILVNVVLLNLLTAIVKAKVTSHTR